jgi:RNA polymerase sigma-70 factor (ECF subfamily)
VWTASGTADDASRAVVHPAEPLTTDGPPGRSGAGGGADAEAGEERPAGAAAPAFADLYRDHAPFVWQVLRRLGVRPADIEDACQEVFLVVHRKLDAFERRSSMRTWLYGIAVRCAADHRRKNPPPAEPPADAAEPAVDAGQPDSIARRQARALLDELLDALDDDKRAVFVLYELEELPMSEVAAVVGCPLQTAYSRLHAARDAVQAAVRRRRAREGTP